MSTNPLLSGPDGWARGTSRLRHFWVCDQCGAKRDSITWKPLNCRNDGSRMREVTS